MIEQKARNISILLVSVETLLVYLYVIFTGLIDQINELQYMKDPQIAAPVFTIAFMTIFTALIVSGVFYKWAFYLTGIIEISVFILLPAILHLSVSLASFGPISTVFIILFPYTLYFILKLFAVKKKMPEEL
ncbi:MAG: hypothetical protein ACYCYI_10220 [Saccharofermentanales bacterium]